MEANRLLRPRDLAAVAMGPIAGRLEPSLDIAPFRFSRFAEGAVGRPRNVL